jgi:hypothetical protein
MIAIVAVVAVICAALIHLDCSAASPLEGHPEPGTPRAGYCSAIGSWRPWLSFTLGPTAVAALVGWPLRRWAWALLILAAVVIAVVIVDLVVARSLRPTILNPLVEP